MRRRNKARVALVVSREVYEVLRLAHDDDRLPENGTFPVNVVPRPASNYPLYAFCAEQLPDDWRQMSSGQVAHIILTAAKDPCAPRPGGAA